MAHPLVLQLRFTRSEFKRAIAGISEEDARKRVLPMNCVSWTVGHLAWQEQRYFLSIPGAGLLLPEIQEGFRYGAPHSTPVLADMWSAWETVTRAAYPWLEGLTTAKLREVVAVSATTTAMYGNLLQRVIYHYWYHTGENMAVRKILGHTGLGTFVGNIDNEAPYTPEGDQ